MERTTHLAYGPVVVVSTGLEAGPVERKLELVVWFELVVVLQGKV